MSADARSVCPCRGQVSDDAGWEALLGSLPRAQIPVAGERLGVRNWFSDVWQDVGEGRIPHLEGRLVLRITNLGLEH